PRGSRTAISLHVAVHAWGIELGEGSRDAVAVPASRTATHSNNPYTLSDHDVAPGLLRSRYELIASQASQGRIPEKTCVAVVQEYRGFVGKDARVVEILTEPGDDGISILSADANARRCGVDSTTLRDLIK
ncbi:MAG: hypothetical protein ACRDSZ_17710, partial [Pseudonocardiaceae bacterium]